MALESGTYISDLVVTNPVNTDTVDKADDHLRLLKSTIKSTFPNITGAVTATHTQLNYVTGVTSALQTQLDAKAPLASPSLTGVPLAPTAAVDTNTTQLATTAYVVGQGYAKLAGPTFTGVPAAPTAAVDTSTTQVATTAYVVGQGYLKSSTASSTYAPLASPALSGVPTAPTAGGGTNTTQIATTAFVTAATAGVVSATTANVLSATAAATAGAVGTYAFMQWPTGSTQGENTTVAGSSITFTNNNAGSGGSAGAGTWRLMGRVTSTAQGSLFLRIS